MSLYLGAMGQYLLMYVRFVLTLFYAVVSTQSSKLEKTTSSLTTACTTVHNHTLIINIRGRIEENLLQLHILDGFRWASIRNNLQPAHAQAALHKRADKRHCIQ